jgi:hypothetical protein
LIRQCIFGGSKERLTKLAQRLEHVLAKDGGSSITVESLRMRASCQNRGALYVRTASIMTSTSSKPAIPPAFPRISTTL